MHLRWQRHALFLCLGALAALAASCEVVLGIHEPPTGLVDAAERPSLPHGDGSADLDVRSDAGVESGAKEAAMVADASAEAAMVADARGDLGIAPDAGAGADGHMAVAPDAGADIAVAPDASADMRPFQDAAREGDQDPSLAEGLIVHYEFDDPASASLSATAIDSARSQGSPRNATLVNTSTGSLVFSSDRQVGTHSLAFSSTDLTSGPYATTLPSPGLRDLAPAAMTVAVWIFVADNARNMQRIFDFGASGALPKSYMFLTPSRPGNGVQNMRFVISRDGQFAEEIIDGPAPSLNEWHHVVVVLPMGAPYTGRLYVDGALQGLNSNMTLHASDLGATDQNFLGRSQFGADPTFVGKLDDFRIYARALSEMEILRLVKLR